MDILRTLVQLGHSHPFNWRCLFEIVRDYVAFTPKLMSCSEYKRLCDYLSIEIIVFTFLFSNSF